MIDENSINVVTLAYLGDSIYEVYIRKNLIKNGIIKVDDLQKEAINYVSAKAQSSILNKMIEESFLNTKELDIVRRGRNYKRSTHPKNTDIITYKLSTGFEAMIGYLYLYDRSRLEEVLNYIKIK